MFKGVCVGEVRGYVFRIMRDKGYVIWLIDSYQNNSMIKGGVFKIKNVFMVKRWSLGVVKVSVMNIFVT